MEDYGSSLRDLFVTKEHSHSKSFFEVVPQQLNHLHTQE